MTSRGRRSEDAADVNTSLTQHYNGGDGVTVDDVNENWPVVYCMSGVCSGQASNTWAPAAADLYAGLSIGKLP